MFSVASAATDAHNYDSACLYRAMAHTAGNRDAKADLATAVHHLEKEFQDLHALEKEIASLRLDAAIERTEGKEDGPAVTALEKKLAEFKLRQEQAVKLAMSMESDALKAFQAAETALEEHRIPTLGGEPREYYDAAKIRDAANQLKAAYAKVVAAHAPLAALIRMRTEAVAAWGKEDLSVNGFANNAVDRSNLDALQRIHDRLQGDLNRGRDQVVRIRDRMTRPLQVATSEAEADPSDATAKARMERLQRDNDRVDEMLGKAPPGQSLLDRVLNHATRVARNEDPFLLPPLRP